jgi:transposase
MLLAECGADMSAFRTAAHLASWARICPINNTSGGKSRSGRTATARWRCVAWDSPRS